MKVEEFIKNCESSLVGRFAEIDDIVYHNQKKVLDAFRENKIALRHFSPTSGYGYDDIGREALSKVYSQAFCCENAIVSPMIASGTHALTLVLFGLLRPDDVALSLTGAPYDTLTDVISGENIGSLKDFGIGFETIGFGQDGGIDFALAAEKFAKKKYKVVFIQRSRGYSWRDSLSAEDIGAAVRFVREKCPDAAIVIDNCYGEFTQKQEPTDFGADVIAGSLIKNPGGGIAPTGGYIAGKDKYIEQISYRLTAPGVGMEVGSYSAGYQPFFQGFFLAPHIVGQALKSAALFAKAFSLLGYEVLPADGNTSAASDIIASIKFGNAEKLIGFCQAIQRVSPVDSHLIAMPWAMPGYLDEVIMAAGAFVQGASIELSADAPIKEPYIAYVQGGLTFEHAKIALTETLISLYGDEITNNI